MEDIPQEIKDAQAACMIAAPFFAGIAYRAGAIVVTDKDDMFRGIHVPTAATDGHHLIFSPKFMKTLTLGERVFVMCHEIWHLMARHAQRFQTYSRIGLHGHVFIEELAQICADAVINHSLKECSIGHMPRGGVDLSDMLLREYGYRLTGQEAWEDVYKLLLDSLPKAPGGGVDASDDALEALGLSSGQGKGDRLKGDVLKPGQAGQEPVSELEMKAATQMSAVAAKAVGKLPGAFERLLAWEPDEIPWDRELEDMVVTTAGADDYSWSRPNKRRLIAPGVYTPRLLGSSLDTLVLSVDTSGSVGGKELEEMLNCMVGILSRVKASRALIVWCDARVQRVDEVESPEDFIDLMRNKPAPGGGGTSFRPPFEWLAAEGIVPDVHIYLTDLMGPFPDEHMVEGRLIWAATTSRPVPVGEVVRLPSAKSRMRH